MRQHTLALWGLMVLSALLIAGAATAASAGDRPTGARALAALAGSSAQTIQYTYDAAGRLVQENHGDLRITYTYDAAGNLLHTGPALAGDMDMDCDVDVVDIMMVAGRWNSRAGDPRYDARHDLDSDGDIDIVDIMRVATRWNQHC